MKVKRVKQEDVGQSYPCMHDLPPQFQVWEKFVPQSKKWFGDNLGRYVEGYHLMHGQDVTGHIYYSTSEKALVPFKTEPNVAFIYCVYLEQEYQGKGHGKELFDGFKEEMRKQGFKGILVDATDSPEYMHHSHFEKQGFKTIKEHGPFKFMYFPLKKEMVEVTPMEIKYKPSDEKVEVTLFKNFFCPVAVAMYHLAKGVAETFGDAVNIVEIEPTPEVLERYGVADGVLFNGKRKIMGPASEEDARKAIQEEIEKFQASSK